MPTTEQVVTQPLTIKVEEKMARATLSRPLVLGGRYEVTIEGYTPKGAMSVILSDSEDNPLATTYVEDNQNNRILNLATQALLNLFKGNIYNAPPLAIATRVYVLDEAQTVGIGQATVLWTKFFKDAGLLAPIDLRGHVGPKGDQGPEGKQGKQGLQGPAGQDGYLLGGVTFKIEDDGHLYAYAQDPKLLYFNGNKEKPFFRLGDGSTNFPKTGHLYHVTYEPEVESVDVGNVTGPKGDKGRDGYFTREAFLACTGIPSEAADGWLLDRINEMSDAIDRHSLKMKEFVTKDEMDRFSELMAQDGFQPSSNGYVYYLF